MTTTKSPRSRRPLKIRTGVRAGDSNVGDVLCVTEMDRSAPLGR